MRKRLWSVITACILLASVGIPIGVEAAPDWNVKISDVDYYVEFNDTSDVFICNKQSIGSKVGTEYYMTYTVEDITARQFHQNGVLGTNVPTQSYPYLTGENGGGFYQYDPANKLLVKGKTYFLKFVVTKDGYSYKVAWAEEEKSKYIEFSQTYGDIKSNLGYFGVWFGDEGLTGKLTKVRFYDKDGNDLGAQVTSGRNATVGREKAIPKDTQIAHTYDITVEDGRSVAISNRKIPTSNKVYMEYKVESADSHIYQTGVVLSNAPKAGYPYENGLMLYEKLELDPAIVGNGPMLTPGADYLIIYEKKADKLEVTVQQTLNGKTSFITFPLEYGTFYESAQYYSLWFGEGAAFPVNCVLTNFKCYDSNKNNLGVQCNQSCNIIHKGELEDYAGCEAVYYCNQDESLYALYGDKALKYTKNGETLDGSYRIEDAVISLAVNGNTEDYDFLYRYFKNAEGKQYNRLYTYKAVFDTGKGSAVEDQILSADSGYVVMRPADPELKGDRFVGWYTEDGEEFDFNQLVTKSITLYAKWENEAYENRRAATVWEYMPYIVVGVSAVILIMSGVCGGIILKKGKKNEGQK